MRYAYLCPERSCPDRQSFCHPHSRNAILENTEAEMENPAQEPLSAEGSSPEETQLQIGEHRDSALNIRIPAGAAAIFGALVSLGIISAVVITLRRHEAAAGVRPDPPPSAPPGAHGRCQLLLLRVRADYGAVPLLHHRHLHQAAQPQQRRHFPFRRK